MPLVITAILLVPIVVAGQASPQARAPQADEFLKGVVVLPSLGPGEKTPSGVKWPVVKSEAKPQYTRAAMAEKIEGSVELQIVVGTDGAVARARVTKSLDKVYGLDEAALTAAKAWTFEPGTLDGTPVPVAVGLVLEFRMKQEGA